MRIFETRSLRLVVAALATLLLLAVPAVAQQDPYVGGEDDTGVLPTSPPTPPETPTPGPTTTPAPTETPVPTTSPAPTTSPRPRPDEPVDRARRPDVPLRDRVIARTGVDSPLALLLVVGLLGGGVAALVTARRRARRSS